MNFISKNKKQILLGIVAVLSVATLLLTGKVLQLLLVSKSEVQANLALQSAYVEVMETSQPQETEESSETEAGMTSPIDVDFPGLLAINPDVVGWLYCEGTKIDYPVLHSFDDVFYLSRNIQRNSAVGGSIFLSCSNFADFSDTHCILYGHRMTNGTMFGNLGLWEDADYFLSHPLYLNTVGSGNYLLKPIAILETPYNSPVYTLDFSPEELALWVDWLRSESLVDSSYTFHSGDRFISFSTCSRHRNDTRLVLSCVMIPIK